MQEERDLLIFSGNANRPLAEVVCEELGRGLVNAPYAAAALMARLRQLQLKTVDPVSR